MEPHSSLEGRLSGCEETGASLSEHPFRKSFHDHALNDTTDSSLFNQRKVRVIPVVDKISDRD
jgi:hypothetical protein